MATVEELAAGELQELARKHLWMHFTRMGAFDAEHEIPIIVRGEGCYVYDQHGNRYLDGLTRPVLREHRPRPRRRRPGRRRPGARSSASSRTGATRTRRRSSSPRASARSRPATSTASSSPPAAPRPSTRRSSSAASTTSSPATRPLQGHRAQDRLPRHDDGRADRDRHHGRARAVRAAVPRRLPRPNTNPYRPEVDDPAEAIRERILFEGPETVSCVILEPVQNSGGCFVPPDGYFQRVREICDEFDILFISDEVICSWGRLGE